MVRRAEDIERGMDCACGPFVGDEHDDDAVAVLAAALDQAFDRDARIAHRRRDLGEDADAVLDDQADIMFADARAGIGGGARAERATGPSNGTALLVPRVVLRTSGGSGTGV